ERAYQIFGAEFLDGLLALDGGLAQVARVRGYISAPRERRTTRDAQYLFVNGRFVRDRLVARALTEGYRTVLPQGVYPAALLFLDVPLEEVDVNVHPAKTEVRFRRAAAVADVVRECVRAALAAGGYLRRDADEAWTGRGLDAEAARELSRVEADEARASMTRTWPDEHAAAPQQEAIEFGFNAPRADVSLTHEQYAARAAHAQNGRDEHAPRTHVETTDAPLQSASTDAPAASALAVSAPSAAATHAAPPLPPLNSIA